MVTGEYAPGTPESRDLAQALRDTVGDIPGLEAPVGGAEAADVNARAGNARDLLVVARS